MQAGQPGQVVFGLAVQDPVMAQLTQRVLMVSLLSMVLVLMGNMTVGISGDGGKTILGFFISMLVPLCGYCGAKNNDPTLMCCFCGCNLASALCSAIGVCMLWVRVSAINDMATNGVPSQKVDLCVRMGGNHEKYFRDACWDRAADDCVLFCEEYLKSRLDLSWAAFALLALCQIPGILLSGLGFLWGNRLYRELQGGRVIVAVQPAYPMTATAAQPAYPTVSTSPAAVPMVEATPAQPTAGA